MDFAQWAQIPNGFNFDLLSNDVGPFWPSDAGAAGVIENGDHSGRHVRKDHKSGNFSLIAYSSIQSNLPLVLSKVHRTSARANLSKAKNTKSQ
jgi:hypothetical protein